MERCEIQGASIGTWTREEASTRNLGYYSVHIHNCRWPSEQNKGINARGNTNTCVRRRINKTSMLCTSTRILFISTTKRVLTAPLSRFISNKPIIRKPLFTTPTPSLYFTLRRTDHTMASSASNPQSIHDFTVKVISYHSLFFIFYISTTQQLPPYSFAGC